MLRRFAWMIENVDIEEEGIKKKFKNLGKTLCLNSFGDGQGGGVA